MVELAFDQVPDSRLVSPLSHPSLSVSFGPSDLPPRLKTVDSPKLRTPLFGTRTVTSLPDPRRSFYKFQAIGPYSSF